MVQRLILALAFGILKRALPVLKSKAASSPNSVDDVAVEVLSDVVDLYESGKLTQLLQS